MKRITYNKNGMIEGNLYDLPKKLRMKAIIERTIWMLKEPITWLVFIMMILVIAQINQLTEQCKMMAEIGIKGVFC